MAASSTPRQPRIGLALGGGGPLGGIYEIGALRALDEALDGLDNLTVALAPEDDDDLGPRPRVAGI